jgi:hypothetical protein
MTISLEKIFFGYILKNKKYIESVEFHYFKNNEIQFVYRIIKEYMDKVKEPKIPSARQIFEMIQLEDKDRIITKDIFKSLMTTNLEEYDEKNFIIPKINAWILSNKIKSGTLDIIQETRNLDVLNEYEDVLKSSNKIRNIVETMSKTNFEDDDDMGSDFDNPDHHSQDSSKYKIDTGFETINHMLGGGWDIGSLNLLMGSTNNGKCFCPKTKVHIRSKKLNTSSIETASQIFEKLRNR